MAPRLNSGKQHSPPRAPRFRIPMPIRYRRAGEIAWSTGTVENISRSGVLFRVEQLMEPRASVDMSFELPVEIGGEPGAQVICRGEIVRAITPPSAEAPPAMAARILDYRFIRGHALPDVSNTSATSEERS